MKKATLAICFMVLLGIGTLNITKAGSINIQGNVTGVTGQSRSVRKTTATAQTTVAPVVVGSPDLLKTQVMQDVAKEYRLSNDVVVSEGSVATTPYYSTSSSNSGLGIKLRIFAYNLDLVPFPINANVNYY